MEKWWEAPSSSPEDSHVISLLDSQTLREMKQSSTETEKAAFARHSHAVQKQEFKCHGFIDWIMGQYSEPLFCFDITKDQQEQSENHCIFIT